jgi:hypothetical protein
MTVQEEEEILLRRFRGISNLEHRQFILGMSLDLMEKPAEAPKLRLIVGGKILVSSDLRSAAG